MNHSSITRDDRLAYIDFFREARDLAIRSPFHILLFDESLSPVLQALTLEEILGFHPTDAPHPVRLWSCADVAEIFKMKRELWEKGHNDATSLGPPGTVMLIAPPLDKKGQREAGTWETVFYRDE